MARTATIEPHADYGFFGPDSMTWRVWSYPTTPVIGLSRAVVVEELDPPLIAAVDATGKNYSAPRNRYDRTVHYFAAAAFAGSRGVLRMADTLVKVHAAAIGVEPVSGGHYDANDPHSQLWILLTAWHSVLKAYEVYGPGKLSPAEEEQYWAECAIAAELQTCDPADVPRSREEIRAYFERMRPHLAASEAAQKMMAHLLNPAVVLPDFPAPLRPVVWVTNRTLRAGTIATLPRWIRSMGGFGQPRAVDVAVRPVLRIGFGLVNRSKRLTRLFIGTLAPSALPVMEPIWRGLPPVEPVVVTPADARARTGYARPADAHLELRRRQAARVFAATDEPELRSRYAAT